MPNYLESYLRTNNDFEVLHVLLRVTVVIQPFSVGVFLVTMVSVIMALYGRLVHKAYQVATGDGRHAPCRFRKDTKSASPRRLHLVFVRASKIHFCGECYENILWESHAPRHPRGWSNKCQCPTL